MKVFIVGVGLSESEIGTQIASLKHPRNIGKREVGRLMGLGKMSGKGPLASLFNNLADHHNTGDTCSVIILENQKVDSCGVETELSQALPVSINLLSSGLGINWRGLSELLEKEKIGSDDRVLVVGTHTELELLTVCQFLKNNTAFKRVATSPHLVASATPEGHLSTLRHQLPNAEIEVLLDMDDVAEFVGISLSSEISIVHRCQIEPPAIKEALNAAQTYIIETLCMHWSKVELRPLMGGYSGSLLFIANGWKNSAKAEPAVIKIDSFDQMRREINGYHLVKDLLGKHIPTFGYPVSKDGYTGVAMELASMEGNPETLQDIFESASDDESVGRFNKLLEKSMNLLGEKLYGNTRELGWVVPYREFDLHTSAQIKYMKSNFENISNYLKDDGHEPTGVDINELAMILKMISKNDDGLNSEISLSHGDLNYANIICDRSDNIWLIDWTHTGYTPLELDFAKLENDAKFVMSKNFEIEDMDRFKKFNEYLLSIRIPADINELPDELNFVKWDLRFRKSLQAIRQLRITCFGLKEDADWIVYKIALLRYSLHNLSFDKRRGRGECELPTLVNALGSTDWSIFNLVADDFHLKIRSEKPASYPDRLRISIDEVPWSLDSIDYDPSYFVDKSVLDNDSLKTKGGWAHPEAFSKVENTQEISAQSKYQDAEGRPLNPRGRTGLAGRGLLGKWGKNEAIALIIMRLNSTLQSVEILIGSHSDTITTFELPKSFQLPEESDQESIIRILKAEVGIENCPVHPEKISEGYMYDPRQTDHAWVEMSAYILWSSEHEFPDTFDSPGWFDELRWYPLDEDIVNDLPDFQADLLRTAIITLKQSGRISESNAEDILEKTG